LNSHFMTTNSNRLPKNASLNAKGWESLRLTDRVQTGVRVLLVGINPGVRSAQTGHHFAGASNRFWKLLYDSRLVPERLTFVDDVRLPEWGLGITNVVARPSPGIDVLRPAEYLEGSRILERKVDRFRPNIVAFVGVTLYRALAKVLGDPQVGGIAPGFQRATIHGARIFVLPNPSGRNANFSYEEMLTAFRRLRRAMRHGPISARPSGRGRSDASSTESAAAAQGRSHRAAGTDRRTPRSTPAAGPSRTARRTRAASR
jgi:TDG/mug DNA glycosylase family protein